MRIMTTNIWGDYFNNPVSVREDNIYKIYENYKPDIIGFQEIECNWYKSSIFKKLSENYYLIGTRLYDNDNFVPLAVKKSFKLKAQGFEYLAYTPDPSKAVTWAVLENKDGKVFGVCNTHFWWMTGNEEYEKIRVKNADQLSNLMKYIKERFSCPVFAFGDMNCRIESKVFSVVYPLNGIVHLYDVAEEKDDIGSLHGDPSRDEDGNFHGTKSGLDHTYSIDHMVATKGCYIIHKYGVVEDQYALDATDHSPVYVDVELID